MKKCLMMMVAAAGMAVGAAEVKVGEDPYVGLVCDLIRCRPESRSPEKVNKAQAVLREFLRQHGIYLVDERFNGLELTYAATQPTKTPEILLCAHIDVVPAGIEEQYEPEVRDGKVFGRGACDDLGSVVAAVKALVTANGKKSIGCLFTSDEEIGGPSAKYMVERGYGATRMGIVLECMERPKITYAHKGHSVYEVIAQGKEGHSSLPWDYDNALEMLIAGWAKFLAKWENPTELDDWRTSISATMVSAASDAPNRIPGTAKLTVGCRTVKVGEAEEVLAMLRRETGLEVKLLRGTEPVNSSATSQEIDDLRAAIAKVFGIAKSEVELCRGAGATDMRHLQFIGKPVYLSGTAGDGAHANLEWLDIASIDKMVAILMELARDVSTP